MATLMIYPINARSTGGNPVIINGIDPTDHDCIKGEIRTAERLIQARWNLNGT